MTKQSNHLDPKAMGYLDNTQVVVCTGANRPALYMMSQFIHPNNQTIFLGVDRGALNLINSGYPLDLAIGDFDSVTAKEFRLIEENTKELIKVAAEKDDTDTELALEYIVNNYPEAPVYIFGALGEALNRIDHLISNLYWVYQPRFQKIRNNLRIIESHCQIAWLSPGSHNIKAGTILPDYLSMITMTPVKNLTIKQAKYELSPCDIDYPRAFVSNEFIDLNRSVEVSFDQGLVMVLWIKEE